MSSDIKNLIEMTLVPHTAFETASRRLEQCFSYAATASEPVCIALVGESRTGKSRVLEECQSKHITHRTEEGLEVPILKVKTPSKPTVKALAEIMLHAIGDPRYLLGTENAKTARLQVLLRETGTRMIMIDEFQHFFDKGSRKIIHHVADWLKILVDDSRVALVVAGLTSCRSVLEQNEQLAGRFLSPILMPRFDWSINEHRNEFLGILEAFYSSLSGYFTLPDLSDEELGFRCYCGTGGLIGYLTKFLRQLVWNMLDDHKTTITLDDMATAHRQAVWSQDAFVDFDSPFISKSSIQPTADLLSKVRLIGTQAEERPAPQSLRRRKSTPYLPQILSAG